MMTRRLLILLVLLLTTDPVLADTKTGMANQNKWRRFSFTTATEGEINATLIWSNPNAALWLFLICGSGSNAFTAGDSFSNLDRIARMTVGMFAGIPCAFFVTSLRATSAFRLHVQQSGTQPTRPRAAIRLVEGREGSYEERLAQEQLDRFLKLSAR